MVGAVVVLNGEGEGIVVPRNILPVLTYSLATQIIHSFIVVCDRSIYDLEPS